MFYRNFPKFKKYSGDDVKKIRAGFKDSRRTFARRFCVSEETVKGWETGRRCVLGPVSIIMQQLEGVQNADKLAKKMAYSASCN